MFEHIPKELRDLPQWVCRRGKMPINPRTGKGAKAGQPDTWSSFDDAVHYSSSYDGIGFEFNDNGLVGIDLDHVINPETGEVDQAALHAVELLDSYTEYSPSGTGLHIIVRGDIPVPGKKSGGREMYKAGRYFTVTGHPFGDPRPLAAEDRTKELAELWARWFPDKDKPTPATQPVPLLGDVSVGGKDYLAIGLEKDAKFRELWYGCRPNGNESSDDQALMNKLAYWRNRDREQMKAAFLSSPHFHSKDDAHQRKCTERADYLNRTIAEAIRTCTQTAQEADARFQEQRRPSAQKDFAVSVGCESEKNKFLDMFKPLSAFEEVEAEWLVPGWIPKEQVTLIAADGGVGKTSICCNIAAAITTGGVSILEPPAVKQRTPGKVLLLTTEDSISKMLKRKLRLAGANQDYIIAPDPAADPKNDLRELKFGSNRMSEVIREIKPALCIIDPVQGYVPPDINMGARNAMRDCMATLTALAEETGCTFIVVCHSNKRRGASGRERISDSSDLWDIARSVIMAGYTSEDGVRYLSNEKNNYARLQETILYRIGKNGLPEFVDFSGKRDRDFVEDSLFVAKKKNPTNEDLIAALKEEANPFEPVKFSYSTWEEKHGAALWGGKQPKRALDDVKPALEADGYSLITKKVKIGGQSANGFIICIPTEPEQEEIPV